MRSLPTLVLSFFVLMLAGCGGGGGVSPKITTGQGWTIMVFLNAANDLCPEALPNYLQMQQAALSGSNTKIIVAWKEWTRWPNNVGVMDWSFKGADDTRYYLVQGSKSGSIVGAPIRDLGAGIDMGSPGALTNFIAYCKKNYPANHYLLDMWDHGDGWQEYLKRRPKALFRGISYDLESGNNIQSWDMSQCLAGGNSLDVLAYDACNMQMLESGYQVRNYVKYIVGSEDLTPGPGYDYSLALLPFFTNPNGDTATLCHGFVDQMINYTAQGQEYAGEAVCQSIVAASQLNSVASAVDQFGAALLANKTAVTTIVQNARASAKNYDDLLSNPTNFYFDAVNLAQTIQGSTGVPTAVSTAAANVITAVQGSVLYSRYDLGNLDLGSSGLAMDFSAATTFNESQGSVATAAAQYANLAFAQDYPHWYQWLQVAP